MCDASSGVGAFGLRLCVETYLRYSAGFIESSLYDGYGFWPMCPQCVPKYSYSFREKS